VTSGAFRGMTLGMTLSKIAISIPSALVQKARRAVKTGRAESVSAYIAAAVAEKAKHEDLADLLQEMLAETGGPMTAEERRKVSALIGIPSRKKKTRAA
jgi:Arc/MetJ-type ribon-helix-helix transcriptional regulator